jgi:serine/threonine protein phosphatase PrpC
MNLAALLSGWRRSEQPMTTSETGIRSVTRTHVGRVRTVNEDRVFDCAARGLWAVADGMGGHSAGDIAAQAIVDALRRLADDPAPFDDEAIDATLLDAGRRIHADAAGSTRVSGSTIVALHLDDTAATLFWAGDSRAYRVRNRRIEQLSRDHSLVQELVDSGVLAAEQAGRHPQAHVITRALGAMPGVAIERRSVGVQPGDLYLLCSDGLTRGHSDPALLDYVGEPLDTIADELLGDALTAGGADNISLVLIAVGAMSCGRD